MEKLKVNKKKNSVLIIANEAERESIKIPEPAEQTKIIIKNILNKPTSKNEPSKRRGRPTKNKTSSKDKDTNVEKKSSE